MTQQIVKQGLNFVTNALVAGHPVGKILNLLLQIPYYANFINRARTSGHTDDQIINFLKEAETISNPSKYTEKEIESKARKLQQGQQKSILGGAIPFAAGAVAANLLPQILAEKGQPLTQTQPPIQPQPIPSGGMPPIPAPIPSGNMPPIPAPIPSGGMPQAPTGGFPPQAPNVGGPPISFQEPLLQTKNDLSLKGLQKQFETRSPAQEEGKILSIAKKMLSKAEISAKMDVEQVKRIFDLNDNEANAVMEIFHDQTKGIYLKPVQAVEAPTKQKEPTLDGQVAKEVPRVSKEALKQFEAPEIEFPKLDISKVKKGQEVVTPNDELGTIEAFSGSGVLVKVDGKVKKLKIEELEGPPEFIKSAKIVIDPAQVEEAAKSAALGLVYHTPDKKNLSVMYQLSGDFYDYKRKDGKPIDDDILNRIQNGMTMPITSGDSYLGAWDSSIADSRGTVVAKEIRDLAQDESEPDDPSKPYTYTKKVGLYKQPIMKNFFSTAMGVSKQYDKSKRKPKPKTKPKPKPKPKPKKAKLKL